MNKLGGILTAAIIIVAVIFVALDWCAAKAMTLNEWGDFIAGFAAMLAFLWLVLGYYQQNKELKQNTEMLRLQRQEMEELVATTREQTDSMVKTQSLDRIARIRDAQPVFDYSRVSVDLTENPDSLSIVVTNTGKHVAIRRITASEPAEITRGGHIKTWDYGEDHEIRIDLSDCEEKQAVISIEYVDLFEIRQTQLCDVWQMASGDYLAEPRPWMPQDVESM